MNDDDLDRVAHEVLTDRQRQVWELDSRGFSQRQIAAALGVQRSTVRDHLTAATAAIHKALRGAKQ